MTEQFWRINVECGCLKSLARMLQEWPWLLMGGHFGDRAVITALCPIMTWPKVSRKSDNHSPLLWTLPKGKEYSQREREVLSSVSQGKPATNLYLHSKALDMSKEQETIWRESSTHLLSNWSYCNTTSLSVSIISVQVHKIRGPYNERY